ncbi:hypothetical protein D6779_00345, partial [Candidatus Parcubacteria bacterium]
IRPFMIRYLSDSLPLYIVTEHPKSGGSWVGQMLADYLDVPFPRNRVPSIEACIMHGHYLRRNLQGRGRTFVVIRDGRDVMVSWYYHCFFINDRENQRLVSRMRRWLPFEDYHDIRANLPEFIRFHFSYKRPFGFSWADFTRDWVADDSRLPYYIKYERLLEDGVNELAQAISAVLKMQPDVDWISTIVDKYSFTNLSGRKQGEEQKNSFLRKGIAGDWKNHFSEESKELFDKYAGEELIRLGYEEDHSWAAA